MPSKREIETAEAKPKACPVILANIPQVLRGRRQWVLWGFQRRDDRWTKVPLQRGGEKAKADNPKTWCGFEAVANYVTADGALRCYDGIGFEFSADDPYTGVDLDDAIDPETNQLKPWAQAIVDQLQSYSEASPSGTGIKIWVQARKPGSACKVKWQDGEVEMYDHGRYFAVTGQH